MVAEIIVIPSRAGTKNKGLWKLDGRPLVDWVMAVADQCRLPTFVTSDQPEVLAMAEDYGFRPHLRPEYLRGSQVSVADVVIDLLSAWLFPDTIVHLLQPTSPFVGPLDLETAARYLDQGLATSAQNIHRTPHNYHALNARKAMSGRLVDFEYRAMRLQNPSKQTKPEQWSFGNLVSTRLSALRKERQFFTEQSCYFTIPRWRAFDIDTEDDLHMAEWLLRGKECV